MKFLMFGEKSGHTPTKTIMIQTRYRYFPGVSVQQVQHDGGDHEDEQTAHLEKQKGVF